LRNGFAALREANRLPARRHPRRRIFRRGENMAITQEQLRGNEYFRMNEQIQETLRNQRRRVEELARLLSEQSIHQWQRAVEGMVALPAAVVTSAAATTLYAVGFVARGFEVFQEAALDSQKLGQHGLDRREGNEQLRQGEQQQLNPNAPRA
jgi:hypothetical protein